MDEEFRWLAPMSLWPRMRSVLPPSPPRPQGGGTQRADERAVFAAVAFVLVTGAPWRSVPRIFGVSWQNAHRRFLEWSRTDVWRRLGASTAEAPDSAEAAWAATLERAARARLREAASARTDAAVADPRPVWRKPVVRRAQRNLVERLFGRDVSGAGGPAGGPAPPSARAAGERSAGTPARPPRSSTDAASP